ncbi:MAG TPA: helix-turn-helix transcriptional regulator [Burkholderiaceae bacterium]|jgi:transcriptional regulator with XRE-family HTH domain|nr:helix-turn-helix transcriptional regulator [Burkholderiaceae bacterium]
MALAHLTDSEIALRLAAAIRAWRVSPEGAAMTQAELAEKSGIGTTSLKRFEKTGAITLRSLIAILRALGLVDRLEDMVPQPDSPGPLAILQAARARKQRRRAPRRQAVGAKPNDAASRG